MTQIKDKEICIDLSNLKNLRQGNLKNKKTEANLFVKYNQENHRGYRATETKSHAPIEKIKQHDNQIIQFQQNLQFRANQY